MTDETKKLFDAPWQCECFELYDKDGHSIAQNIDTEENSCRLSHLPELYDALMYFVVNDCPHAFVSNDECRLCPNKKCKTREAVELLRKVRDGK